VDEGRTSTIREPDATTHHPPQHQLMSERSILCLKSTLRFERREHGQEEAEPRDHRR
jgi:hypothetical protein